MSGGDLVDALAHAVAHCTAGSNLGIEAALRDSDALDRQVHVADEAVAADDWTAVGIAPWFRSR